MKIFIFPLLASNLFTSPLLSLTSCTTNLTVYAPNIFLYTGVIFNNKSSILIKNFHTNKKIDPRKLIVSSDLSFGFTKFTTTVKEYDARDNSFSVEINADCITPYSSDCTFRFFYEGKEIIWEKSLFSLSFQNNVNIYAPADLNANGYVVNKKVIIKTAPFTYDGSEDISTLKVSNSFKQQGSNIISYIAPDYTDSSFSVIIEIQNAKVESLIGNLTFYDKNDRILLETESFNIDIKDSPSITSPVRKLIFSDVDDENIAHVKVPNFHYNGDLDFPNLKVMVSINHTASNKNNLIDATISDLNVYNHTFSINFDFTEGHVWQPEWQFVFIFQNTTRQIDYEYDVFDLHLNYICKDENVVLTHNELYDEWSLTGVNRTDPDQDKQNFTALVAPSYIDYVSMRWYYDDQRSFSCLKYLFLNKVEHLIEFQWLWNRDEDKQRMRYIAFPKNSDYRVWTNILTHCNFDALDFSASPYVANWVKQENNMLLEGSHAGIVYVNGNLKVWEENLKNNTGLKFDQIIDLSNE